MATTGSRGPDADVRLPWSRSDRRFPRMVIRPLQAFLQTEASGGILLLLAAVMALVWANSPWHDSYERLWYTTLAIGFGRWSLSEDLRHWVNDGLMTLFFLVVGLEIKREVLTGELRDPRTAALPAVAALGGMVVPALLYAALNVGGEGASGWGIPMATDIAFALGVLILAARHASPGLKPFLLTLAIVDDIGAIVVIAVVYSGGITWGALAVAVALCGLIVLLQRVHVRAGAAYVALGIGVWLATFESGVHPTIAGVALGLLTPAVPFQRPRAVSDEAHRIADRTVDDPVPPDADAPLWLSLAGLTREAVSPLARLEEALHPWTSWLIVPVFALANAGMRLSGSGLREAATSPVAIGIVLGLVLGKLGGISLASLLAVRTRLARLPEGVTWSQLVGTSLVAGVGFTVSLFISGLAFPGSTLRDVAKVAIL
ncbi:MAG: Na+/H+ antiporter NhaA, partial [Candidatus Velamenicoccus archaeovorus]